jgi:hypothetical protein
LLASALTAAAVAATVGVASVGRLAIWPGIAPMHQRRLAGRAHLA